jgi:hypothetical protein
LPIRSCCIEHNFQFVTEIPAEGFQPGQRFHIRLHMMKQYKRSQRLLRQTNSTKFSRKEGENNNASVRTETADDDRGSNPDNPLQADVPALRIGRSKLHGGQRPRNLPVNSTQSRSAPIIFKSPMPERRTIVSSPASAS